MGTTVNVADTDTPFNVAVMVAVVTLVTALVAIVKGIDVAFEYAPIIGGTKTAGLLLVRATPVEVPPACPFRVTAPADEFPPRTEAELKVIEVGTADTTVSVADFELGPLETEIGYDVKLV